MRMRQSLLTDRFFAILGVVSAVVLIVSAFVLVTTQYTVRMLTFEKDRAEKVSQRLLDEKTQLRVDQSKAALPKIVIDHVKDLEYVEAGVHNTVMIEVPSRLLENNRMEVSK